MKTLPYLILLSIVLALFSPHEVTTASGYKIKRELKQAKGIIFIGAIVDDTSRVGKEAKVGIQMALDDFNTNSNQRLLLHIRNSRGKPLRAALAARDLIDKHQVKALLGPQKWEEASLVAEVGSGAHIPTLALVNSMPQWATERWPFLIQASPGQYAQMKAVAAVLKSLGQHQVTVIYEDIESLSNEVSSHLIDALREVGVEISRIVKLPPFDSSALSEELERLKRKKCRVFVVHTSLGLAVRLFQKATKMGMMEKSYVWIATNTITDLLHSINASTISSIQGIIGVGSYYPKAQQELEYFNQRFQKKFQIDHPEEENHEPGIFAMQAYDATRALALALNETTMGGQELLEKLSQIDFSGMSGKVQFIERKLAAADIFEIVNMIEKRYSGFWSDRFGFKETIDDGSKFGKLFQPRQINTLRGRSLQTSSKVLRVGVPTTSLFEQFVNVVYDRRNKSYSYSGFSIDIFKEIMDRLPQPYEFIQFDGSYDDLVKEVHLENFDAVAGDVTILASRYEDADFTQPYTESGLEMIVPVELKMPNKPWLFLKPFTKVMWVLIAVITIYNGGVVFLIERNHCPELQGSALTQVGALLNLAFTTLFSLHGGRLHSNLSRMAMVVWLFVSLIITACYTANLASMLTAQRLVPKVIDIETLLYNNATVGYCRGSFVGRYLEDVLKFPADKVKTYQEPELYAKALRSGEIEAVFLEVPSAKLFLAQYCKSFIRSGETFKFGGFGYAFPKDSPLLPSVNEALLNLSESGKIKELETKYILSEKCVDVESIYNENASFSHHSFWVLFVLTVGTSTISLVIYLVVTMWKLHKSLILNLIKHWRHRRRRFSRRVSHAVSPRNSPNVLDLGSEV